MMMRNPTRRRTECRVLSLFGIDVLFSYDTPVAFYSPFAEPRPRGYRRTNTWGPTTGRHLKEAGFAELPQIADASEFQDLLYRAIYEAIARRAAQKLDTHGEFPA